MKRPQFSLSTILLLTAMIGMGVGWWRTHLDAKQHTEAEEQLRLEVKQLQSQVDSLSSELRSRIASEMTGIPRTMIPPATTIITNGLAEFPNGA